MDYVDPMYEEPWYAQNDAYNPGVIMKTKFREGDNVEVVGNLAGHNQVGACFEVQGYINNFVRLVGSQFNFYEQDLKLLAAKKDRVQERLNEARSAYLLWQAKLDYMEESNKEELEEPEFQKYQLAKLIDNANISISDKIERIKSVLMD